MNSGGLADVGHHGRFERASQGGETHNAGAQRHHRQRGDAPVENAATQADGIRLFDLAEQLVTQQPEPHRKRHKRCSGGKQDTVVAGQPVQLFQPDRVAGQCSRAHDAEKHEGRGHDPTVATVEWPARCQQRHAGHDESEARVGRDAARVRAVRRGRRGDPHEVDAKVDAEQRLRQDRGGVGHHRNVQPPGDAEPLWWRKTGAAKHEQEAGYGEQQRGVQSHPVGAGKHSSYPLPLEGPCQADQAAKGPDNDADQRGAGPGNSSYFF